MDVLRCPPAPFQNHPSGTVRVFQFRLWVASHTSASKCRPGVNHCECGFEMATCHGILHDLAPICGKLHRENDEQTIGLWGLVPRKGCPFGPTKNGASLDIFRIEPATLGGHEF